MANEVEPSLRVVCCRAHKGWLLRPGRHLGFITRQASGKHLGL